MNDRVTLRERLAYAGYAALELLATTLPERTGRRLFRVGGALAHGLASNTRRTVSENLAPVIGRDASSPLVRAAVRDAFRSYARYWHETFLLRVLPREEVEKRFHIEGLNNVDAALEAGRGAVLALPHLGNWDSAGRWLSFHGYRLTAVAEELRPPSLYRLFLEHRRALGMDIVPLSRGVDLARELSRRLRRNQLVALVADRSLRGDGVEVEMFGASRRMPPGPALLSLSTRSPLLPCAVYDTADGWRCLIDGPLEFERSGDLRPDVVALTRRLAGEFERSIAASPVDWHMFQPFWSASAPGGDSR